MILGDGGDIVGVVIGDGRGTTQARLVRRANTYRWRSGGDTGIQKFLPVGVVGGVEHLQITAF